ncbi:MAG: type IX secretion system membrane protein PorP/SprF [Bacteroidota bacterium]
MKKLTIMKKLTTILIAIIGFGSISLAQQDVQFTQYFWNKLLLNSGYAGSHDNASFTLIHRDQWMGIVDDGRPVSSAFSFHTPLRNEKIGIGFSALRDNLGPTENTTLAADFAYRIRIADDSRLAFGVKASLDFFEAQLVGLTGTNGDPAFAQNFGGNTLPNFGASLYYWSGNAFLGASAPQLLENELAESNNTLQGIERRHYFIMGGYVFDISPLFKFKPTFMAKLESSSPASFDATANFLFKEKLWLGAAYRSEDSFDANIAYLFSSSFRAGFAWDFTTSELRNVNDGSWEVMLGYDLNFNKEKLMSPRYF